MAASARYAPRPITDIFTPADTSINRRECKRVVPMKVLILGLGRTGTASMREAMKQLGYVDTYHMMSASIENPPDCLMWQDAFAAKFDGVGTFTRKDWDQLMGHCQAVCDWPAVAFAQELIEAYPEAKVILTGRDVDSWHASTMKTVYWRVTDPALKFVSKFSWAASMYEPVLQRFFDTFFEGDFPKKGKEIYKRHYENVKSMVPPENLLEYKITDGWKPLAEFLDEAVPCVPFPRVNDNADFVTRSQRRNRNQMLNVLFRYAVVGSTFAAGVAVAAHTAKRFKLFDLLK